MLSAGPKLLTVGEAAAELRVSKPTLYRWIAAGELPAIRYGQPRADGDTRRGGAIRIARSTVDDLLANSLTPEVAA